jgi:phospholipid/cholesterol/gamma-HCH transport system permease protein
VSRTLNESEAQRAAEAVERAGVGFLAYVGRRINSSFEYMGGITSLGIETAGTIVKLRIRFAETVNQCFLLGYQSLIIVLLTSLFTGMVFSLESAVQAVQYGFGSFVGGIVSYTNVRELGPMLTAVVVAGRVCAAIAAEIGSMVVTEQVEALQSLGLAPVRFLVVPRVLALMIMLPLLTVFADVVGVMGGQWIAHTQAHIAYNDFMSSARQTIGFEDVVKGLFKAVIFGIVIALVGSYQGLTTSGGAAGVGKSTTSAVVICIILIFFLNFVMSYFLYGGG